ncbi:MAG TPA: hypothetical protein VNZ58_01860 [Thermomicrobiales bacterium]|nr:hypothetical protein [Thermomicrobiales bacterium]
MNTHLESMNEQVAYRQQRIAEDFAAIHNSRFWHDARVQLGQALIRIGEAMDDRCREQLGSVAGRPAPAGLGHNA